jgi:hypothetical protein
MLKIVLLLLTLLCPLFLSLPAPVAGAAETLKLPPPDREGGIPLMRALNLRRSNRSIAAGELSPQDISNLLWAAWGINRDDGYRTVPTARNNQQVNVYAALKSGVWLYDARNNTLIQESADDITGKFGAPLVLGYAAPDEEFGHMHVGSLYQNASLYCASAGLANVVKVSGRDDFARAVKLPKGYKLQMVHLAGGPK